MDELTNLSYKEKKTRYDRLIGQIQILTQILDLETFVDIKILE